jgi:toxin ParE1/3/4
LSRRVRLSAQARQDFRQLLIWSERQFGAAARARYRILVLAALQDLASDPLRRGSRESPGEAGLGYRLYHLKWSRRRSLEQGGGVRSPSHFIAYRELAGGVLFVQRILYEAMDLPKAFAGDAEPDE